LVDLLNNLDHLAEDQKATLEKLRNNVSSYNTEALMKATQQYGTGQTKSIVKTILRNILSTR
jgi:hypothetical protein